MLSLLSTGYVLYRLSGRRMHNSLKQLIIYVQGLFLQRKKMDENSRYKSTMIGKTKWREFLLLPVKGLNINTSLNESKKFLTIINE